MKTTEELKKEITELLEQKKVNLVIAFENYRGKVRPIFVKEVKDLDRVAFDADGGPNLTVYLKQMIIKKQYPVAIVARDVERDSVALLLKESQIKPENVVLIESNAVSKKAEQDKQLDAEIARLWALSPAERKKFWEDHFANCIRCYACRQSCPHCYCQECKADKNRPAWVETSAHGRGNFSWHFLRAFHQAGRCVECGACESACSVAIPLMLLNRMQNQVVKEAFGETDPEKSLLSGWSKDDDNSFFL